MTKLKIALTGGIACGKSQVVEIFSKLGADVIRLDDVSQQVTTPNSQGLQALLEAFGAEILNPDNSLNRQALRKILLQSESNKKRIETILHPKILNIMQKWLKNSKKYLNIVEIPLLVEKNLDYLFDRAIIVSCNDKQQLKRLQKRENISEKVAKSMISMQISHENRLEVAKRLPCDVLENNATLVDLETQVKTLYQKLINL